MSDARGSGKTDDVVQRPIENSYVLPGTALVAGEYPGAPPTTPKTALEQRLGTFLDAGMHLTLRDPPRIGENHQMGKRDFAVGLGSGAVTISLRLTIETDSDEEDAYQLACRCVDAWNAFLGKWQLL